MVGNVCDQLSKTVLILIWMNSAHAHATKSEADIQLTAVSSTYFSQLPCLNDLIEISLHKVHRHSVGHSFTCKRKYGYGDCPAVLLYSNDFLFLLLIVLLAYGGCKVVMNKCNWFTFSCEGRLSYPHCARQGDYIELGEMSFFCGWAAKLLVNQTDVDTWTTYFLYM